MRAQSKESQSLSEGDKGKPQEGQKDLIFVAALLCYWQQHPKCLAELSGNKLRHKLIQSTDFGL